MKGYVILKSVGNRVKICTHINKIHPEGDCLMYSTYDELLNIERK